MVQLAAYKPRTIAVRPVLAGIRLCAKSPGCTLYGSLVSGYLVGSSYYNAANVKPWLRILCATDRPIQYSCDLLRPAV